MTKQDKAQVQEALDNNWEDRLFHYYQIWVDGEAVRPQDVEGIEKYKLELKKLVEVKESKVKTDD